MRGGRSGRGARRAPRSEQDPGKPCADGSPGGDTCRRAPAPHGPAGRVRGGVTGRMTMGEVTVTQPPKGSAAPPGAGRADDARRAAAVRASRAARPVGPRPGPRPATGGGPAAPPRRTAWSEGVDRLRAAATTEPGGCASSAPSSPLLVVAFGAVTAVADDAAGRPPRTTCCNHSQPLSASAADIYRSLADANTAAASGFLAGGQETGGVPRPVRAGHRTAAAEAGEPRPTAPSPAPPRPAP